jgi:membrane fusion protein (multidrug efflux system)
MVSPVEGPIVACSAREGDRVRAGQLLARLGGARGDDAEVVSARAELDKDELELSRIEKLVESGALPGEALDRARVDVSEAQARLAHASEKLGDYRIVAPWSGIVSKVHVTVGDFVSARAALIELFDPDSLVLRFAVPEKKAALIRDAAAITVKLDAYPGQRLDGTVTRVYPEIDRRTHTRTVEAEINGDAGLVPGMFARLVLTLSSVPEAVAVPVEAVIRLESTEPVVFVITDDKVAHRRPVKTGVEDGDRVQILAGVDPGDQVAVAGHGQLRDGAEVRAVGEPGDTAESTRGRIVQPSEAAASDTSP